MNLQGKTIVVAGAGGGLGCACGVAFLQAGATVYGLGRTQANLDEAALLWQKTGGRFQMQALDVTHEAELDAFVARLPGVDVLINTAAQVQYGPVLEMSTDTLRQVLEVNVVGAFVLLRAVGRRMAQQGSGLIVNVTSVAALKGLECMAGYSASKFALRGLGQAAALELRRRGVRVTTFCPGQINTPMLGPGDHPQAMPPAHVAQSIVQLALLPPGLEVREFYVEPLGLSGA